MFVPASFQMSDASELHAFMQTHSFAMLVTHLSRSVAVYERGMPEPRSYDVSDPDLDKMLKAIVGFRIEIRRLEGKAKLNQNHSEERRRKVIRALEAQTDEDSQAIAKLMTATLNG